MEGSLAGSQVSSCAVLFMASKRAEPGRMLIKHVLGLITRWQEPADSGIPCGSYLLCCPRCDTSVLKKRCVVVRYVRHVIFRGAVASSKGPCLLPYSNDRKSLYQKSFLIVGIGIWGERELPACQLGSLGSRTSIKHMSYTKNALVRLLIDFSPSPVGR